MVHETTLWTVRLMRVGVLIAKIPLLAGDVLEDYLHLKGIIAIGDESMWRLRWQQAKMKEAEYEWMPNVDARSTPTDTIPEPT